MDMTRPPGRDRRPREPVPVRTRTLLPSDLPVVVRIDRAATGRSRRLFFEQRLVAVRADPDRYITVGAERDGELVGYAIAHMGKREFGAEFCAAIVEAIGVVPHCRQCGVGSALIRAVEAAARGMGAEALFSQVDWTNGPLLAFFARAGFELAPRTLLERAVQ